MNQQLLLNFFLIFSRFEYALKSSSFFKPPSRNFEAKPDWDTFADSISTVFNDQETEELAWACGYLQENPPMRQIIINGAIGWDRSSGVQDLPEIVSLLRLVRRVRNNLFHGGKFSIGVHEETKRTEMLLKASITILHECLRLSPRVHAEFYAAHL